MLSLLGPRSRLLSRRCLMLPPLPPSRSPFLPASRLVAFSTSDSPASSSPSSSSSPTSLGTPTASDFVSPPPSASPTLEYDPPSSPSPSPPPPPRNQQQKSPLQASEFTQAPFFQSMSPQDVLCYIVDSAPLRETNPDDLAKALARLVDSSASTKLPNFDDCLSRIKSRLEGMSPRGLATVIMSLAKFAQAGQATATSAALPTPAFKDLIESLRNHCRRRASEFSGLALCNVFSAMAGLNRIDKPFLDSFCDVALTVAAGSYDPRHIPITLNSLARLEHYHPKLTSSLCRLIVLRGHEFNPQSISVTLHALGKFYHFDLPSISALCDQAVIKSGAFNPQDVSTTLTALSRLEYYDFKTVDAMCKRAANSANRFGTQAISNTLNALSRFDHYDEECLLMLCESALQKHKYFNTQEASNTLTSLSRLGHYDKQLVSAFCDLNSNEWRAKKYNTLEASNFLGALATFEHYNKSLVQVMCNEIKFRTLTKLHWQGIANTLMAVATFNHNDKKLLNALCTAARSSVEDFSNLNVGEVLHSLSVFGHFDEVLFASLLKRFYSPLMSTGEQISSETKSHLHLVFLSLRVDHGSAALKKLAVPPSLIQACADNAVRVEKEEGAKYDPHRDTRTEISDLLTEMGVLHSCRVRAGGLSVDFLIEEEKDAGEKRVIEIISSRRFLKTTQEMVDGTGGTEIIKGWHVLKDRLLKKQGYNAIHVRHMEWDRLENVERKTMYLKQLLASKQATEATDITSK